MSESNKPTSSGKDDLQLTPTFSVETNVTESTDPLLVHDEAELITSSSEIENVVTSLSEVQISLEPLEINVDTSNSALPMQNIPILEPSISSYTLCSESILLKRLLGIAPYVQSLRNTIPVSSTSEIAREKPLKQKRKLTEPIYSKKRHISVHSSNSLEELSTSTIELHSTIKSLKLHLSEEIIDTMSLPRSPSQPQEEESTEPQPSTSKMIVEKSLPQKRKSTEPLCIKPSSLRRYSTTTPHVSLGYVWTHIRNCKIKGIWNESYFTRQRFCSFLGIRYAEPPIGELRFKPPERLRKVYTEYDATEEKNFCIQRRRSTSKELSGSEDCLFLNIHTPEEPKKLREKILRLPVMVYIHGGGYYCGTGHCMSYCADYLLTHDVILVTFNYRLNILGFLTLEDSICPGNMGLKDQVMALQWIKENIEYFGGNPNNVTIFGSSAGAACVNFHLLSPLSRNLFHKGIIQGGNIYCPWGLARNSLRLTKVIVRSMGGPIDSVEAMFQFLKNLPVEKLINDTIDTIREIKLTHEPLSLYDTCLGPVIECTPENAFLPYNLDQLKKSATIVPIIAGLNTYEGLSLFRSDLFEPNNAKNNFHNILGQTFHKLSEDCMVTGQLLNFYYFKGKDVNNETRENLANMYTDMQFYRFYDSFEFLLEAGSPVYIYEFAYYGQRNQMNASVGEHLALPKASHCDEIPYLLSQKEPDMPAPEVSTDDAVIIKNMCDMWTGFALSGNPTIRMQNFWKPYTSDNPSYLLIDKELKVINEKMFGKRFDYMKSIVRRSGSNFNI